MALQPQKKGSASGNKGFLAVLLALSLLLVAAYVVEGSPGPLHAVQSTVSGLSSPFKFAGTGLGALGQSAIEKVEDAGASSETLQTLRDQNAELRNTVTRLEEYRQEAERLQAALDLRDLYQMEAVSARVIGRNTSAWNQIVTIDKGSDDGLKEGLSVMGSYGLVGQVIATNPKTAEIRLISDQQSGVSAIVQATRAEGIIRGSLEGLLYLEDLAADAQIEVGDVILTSGLGGSHKKGLLIGIVTRIDEEQGDLVRRVVVAPNGKAGPLEELLVVLDMELEFAQASAVATRVLADEASAQEGQSKQEDQGAQEGQPAQDGQEDQNDQGTQEDQVAQGTQEDRAAQGAEGG